MDDIIRKNWFYSCKAILVLTILFVCSLAAQPVSAACVWTGTWDTNWGTMTVDQKGETITGTYEHDNGRITGRVVGNMIIGTWSEAPGYNPPDNAGDFQLTISDDCRSFDGKWKYGSRQGSWDGEWYGHRIGSGTLPVTQQATPKALGTHQQTVISTPDITVPPTQSESFFSGILPVPIPVSSLTVFVSLLAVFGFFALNKR